MAHKKGEGRSRNGRDSPGQRLGVKQFGGEIVVAGQHHRAPARHQVSSRRACLGMGRDHTLFSLVDGAVKFHKGLAAANSSRCFPKRTDRLPEAAE